MSDNPIDAVIAKLEAIIASAKEKQSRIGYFAALYLRVTATIRDKIGTGYFDDDARMETLDVAFAGRYLTALEQFESNDPRLLRSWQVALDATGRDDLIIVQHLLAAMNPHINIDLAAACAEIAPGQAIQALHGDFLKVNDVLASLLPTVIEEIGALSPLIHLVTDLAEGDEEAIINFSMQEARAFAWTLARSLAVLSPEKQTALIEKQDQVIAKLGWLIVDPGPVLSAVVDLVRLPESKDVVRIIETLDTGNPLPVQTPPASAPPASTAVAPNQVYYFEIAAGSWTGSFHFQVQSWRKLWSSSIGLKNKVLVTAMAIWQRVFGDSPISSTVTPHPNRGPAGVATNQFRIARGWFNLFRSDESYTLSPNGSGVSVDAHVRFGPIPFLFREHDTYPATIYDGGLRATYFIKLLGGRFLGQYQVSDDRLEVRSVLSNEFARAEETLTKVAGG